MSRVAAARENISAGARNRFAGRGGGIADASFHLARNAVQVQSWIALLGPESPIRTSIPPTPFQCIAL
jgi:hypothetical protein